MTGHITFPNSAFIIQKTADTLNYVPCVRWRNASGTYLGEIGMHNTIHRIFINPMASADVWNDAVGKYSLCVGGNWLTYNTYPVLTSANYNSYSPTLTGGGASGTWGINVTGNAASATQLQTARSIFGRSFNGTANVAGQGLFYGTPVSAGQGYFNGALQLREAGLVESSQTSDQYAPRIGFHWAGRFGYSIIANTDGFKFQNHVESGYVGLYAGNIIAGGAITANGTLNVSGRADLTGGITSGYENTSYQVSVSSFICNSWVRTVGDTGWVNETYGGGIYMTDTTYVRVCNGKKFYVANATSAADTSAAISTAGGIYAAGNIIAGGAITALATGTSDMRLKCDVKELDGLSVMHAIGKAFLHHWNDRALSLNDRLSNTYYNPSLSAQSVYERFPVAAIEGLYGEYLGVNREVLMPVMWNAVIEVEDEVSRLKKRVSELEEKLNKYEHAA